MGIFTKEARENSRLAKIGKKETEETKRKRLKTYFANQAAGLHKDKTGTYHHTEEAKRRIGVAGRGRHTGKPNVSARAVGDMYAEPLYVRVFQGLPVLCKVHGEHTDWRVSKNRTTVFCRPCVYINNFKYETKNYYLTLEKRCKLLDKESEITASFLAELAEKQNQRCALTGVRFEMGSTRLENRRRVSVDRKDSSIGYKKDNVHLVIHPVNKLKTDFPVDEFLNLCEMVASYTAPEYGISGC